jgi:hypothetical protein
LSDIRTDSPAPPAGGKARAAFLGGPAKLAFLLLKAGLPDHHVFANTRVSDLIDGPKVGPMNNLRIALVVCRKDLAIVAAVDLPTGAQADTLFEREKEQRLRAAARGLFRANGRDVVLGMTRRHARAASRAAVQIDSHSPFVWHIFKLKS